MTKVQFTDPRIIEKVELPSFPGSEIQMFKTLTVWEQREISGKFPNAKNPSHPDAENATMEMIAKVIQSRNFVNTDENWNEVEVPITTESLNKLPLPDLMVLAGVVTGKKLGQEESSPESADEKKNA